MQNFIYNLIHVLIRYGRQHKVCHFINWVTLTDYVRLANKDGEMLSQPSQILRHQIIRCISRAIKFLQLVVLTVTPTIYNLQNENSSSSLKYGIRWLLNWSKTKLYNFNNCKRSQWSDMIVIHVFWYLSIAVISSSWPRNRIQ